VPHRRRRPRWMRVRGVEHAEWNGELIADFAPKRAALRELMMMQSEVAAAEARQGGVLTELQVVPDSDQPQGLVSGVTSCATVREVAFTMGACWCEAPVR